MGTEDSKPSALLPAEGASERAWILAARTTFGTCVILLALAAWKIASGDHVARFPDMAKQMGTVVSLRASMLGIEQFPMRWWLLSPWPPAWMLFTVPFTFLLGTSEAAMLVPNLFVWILCVASVWSFARRTSTPWLAATVSIATALLLHPWMFVYMLDLPVTALIVFAALSLAYRWQFDSAPRAVGIGVIAGIGVMTKWSWAFYMAVPAVVVFVANVASTRPWRERARALTLMVLGLVCAIGAASVFYAPAWESHVLINVFPERYPNRSVKLGPMKSPFFGFAATAEALLPIGILLCAAACTAMSRGRAMAKTVIVSCIVAGTLIMSRLDRTQDESTWRYYLPNVPLLLALVAVSAGSLNARIRAAVVTLTALSLLGAVWLAVSLCLGAPTPPEKVGPRIGKDFQLPLFARPHVFPLFRTYGIESDMTGIVDDLIAIDADDSVLPKVMIAGEGLFWRYPAMLGRMGVHYPQAIDLPAVRSKADMSALRTSDYLIVAITETGELAIANQEIRAKVEALIHQRGIVCARRATLALVRLCPSAGIGTLRRGADPALCIVAPSTSNAFVVGELALAVSRCETLRQLVELDRRFAGAWEVLPGATGILAEGYGRFEPGDVAGLSTRFERVQLASRGPLLKAPMEKAVVAAMLAESPLFEFVDGIKLRSMEVVRLDAETCLLDVYVSADGPLAHRIGPLGRLIPVDSTGQRIGDPKLGRFTMHAPPAHWHLSPSGIRARCAIPFAGDDAGVQLELVDRTWKSIGPSYYFRTEVPVAEFTSREASPEEAPRQ